MNNKLIKIQQELKAPKSNTNSFGNYKYRSAEDILEAVKPLVHAQELSLLLSDKVVQVGDMNYVVAEASLVDDEKSIKVTAYAREAVTKKGMDDAQITGSASSYARKYALNGLFAIDDTKDPDTQDNRTASATVAKPKTDTLAVAKDNLNKMLEEYGYTNAPAKKVTISRVLDKSTVDTEHDANEVIQALEDGLV